MPALVSQHGRDELPGRPRRISPRRRHGDHAICPSFVTVVEEAGVTADQFFPLSECRIPRLDEPTRGRDLCNADQLSRSFQKYADVFWGQSRDFYRDVFSLVSKSFRSWRLNFHSKGLAATSQ
jgi:hypothetical protein